MATGRDLTEHCHSGITVVRDRIASSRHNAADFVVLYSNSVVSLQRNTVREVPHCCRAIRADANEIPLNDVALRTSAEVDAIGIATNNVSRCWRRATNRITETPFDSDPEATRETLKRVTRGVGPDKVTDDRISVRLHHDTRPWKAVDDQAAND